MNLSEIKTGESCIIVKVHGHGSFRKRLIEMGFIAGKKVLVILNAPLKDPIEYEILGYRLSLRREEAGQIEVVSETEAKAVLENETLTPLECNEKDEIALLDEEMKRLAEERKHTI